MVKPCVSAFLHVHSYLFSLILEISSCKIVLTNLLLKSEKVATLLKGSLMG